MSDVSQGPGWWQASDGKWYAPEFHPDHRPPPPPMTGPTPTSSASPTANGFDLGRLNGVSVPTWIMVGASVLLMLGSFMPWVSANVGFLSASANGISGDGQLTLILALLALAALLVGIWIPNPLFLVAPVVLFALSTALCIYEVIHISSKSATSGGITVTATVGIGVYICLISSIAGVVAWLVNRRRAVAAMPTA